MTTEDEKRALARLRAGHLERAQAKNRDRAERWEGVAMLASAVIVFMLILFKLQTITAWGVFFAFGLGIFAGGVIGKVVSVVAILFNAIEASVGIARDSAVVRERKRIIDASEVAGGLQLSEGGEGGELSLATEKGALTSTDEEQHPPGSPGARSE